MIPPDDRPDTIVLPPVTSEADLDPLHLSFLRWKAERGHFNLDVAVSRVCRACNGVHVESRLSCELRLHAAGLA